MMLAGGLTEWNEINVNALGAIKSYFHVCHIETFETFMTARLAPSFPARLFYLYKPGVYRQTALAQVGLFVAAYLRKQ
jgi:hypothetical protein